MDDLQARIAQLIEELRDHEDVEQNRVSRLINIGEAAVDSLIVELPQFV